MNGMLYGTTRSGGRKDRGTVYGISTSGKERILYAFVKKGAGKAPDGSLIDVNGTLYGTTSFGGAYGVGTVYSLTTAGSQKVLYSFSGSGGEIPAAGLTYVKGKFYSTTFAGGSHNAGTVYSVTTDGTQKVLYNFAGGSDGDGPRELIDVNGILYGTTAVGGGSGCLNNEGCGTVFSVTTTGKENVLYRFGGGADGANPYDGLVNVDGTLYGTTLTGGSGSCVQVNGAGCGTVFSVTVTGDEKVVYNFVGGSDGIGPFAGLTAVNGTLYGTTSSGGDLGCANSAGCGTIFSVATAGVERVLHRFGSGSDGADPEAGLANVSNTLYGTTLGGGARSNGTVFALKLST
jgi:uncharacterized repeat protein (TIGR03803 family)